MATGVAQCVRIAIGVTVLAWTAVFGSPSFALASTNTIGSANVLKVSPVRTDVQVAAGVSKSIQVVVTNPTNGPIVVHPVINDFVSGDERGTPALIMKDDAYAPTHSLKRFMKPFADVTIPARGAVAVVVTISVPASARPGGYFGALRLAPTSPGSGGQVNLSASVASLILLTVPGAMTEKLALTDFDIQQGDVTKRAYFDSSKNLQAAVRFKNDGDVQVGPFGKVSVLRGDRVVYEVDFNNKNPRDMTLPSSARRWTIPLQPIGDFGHYTVKATFTYGQKNQSVEVTRSFWVIPRIAIVAAAIGLIVLVGLIVSIWLVLYRRRHRSMRNHERRGGYRR